MRVDCALRLLAAVVVFALVLAGCSSSGKRGGYYKDDGPDANPPSNLDDIPDAIARIDPFARGANIPYVVFGKRYVPDTSGQPYRQRGIASWYGKKFHGNSTSTGEAYDMYAMSAAHKTLPIPSYARVTSEINGRSVIVRVNDRGPFHDDRIVDLSYAAAYRLGIIGPGSGPVLVERLMPDEIRLLAAQRQHPVAGASDAAEVSAMPVSDASPQPAATEALAPLPAPPPVAAAPMLPPASPGSVYLQLGAFSQPDNARTLVERVNRQLSQTGSPPALLDQSGQPYRVRLGPYADRAAATSAVNKVFELTGIMPAIVLH